MTEIQIAYSVGGGVVGLLVLAVVALLASRSRVKAELAAMVRISGMFETDLKRVREEKDLFKAENLTLEKQFSQVATELAAERRQSKEKIALLNDARERLTYEFQVLAQQILEEKGKHFSEHSRAQMEGLILPLREQLSGFKKTVADVYDRESRDRTALRTEISQLRHLNERIGKDALNLTNALKGDVKTMGGWGEVVLERILETSGLEKGRIYETQVHLKDSRGSRYQPDAIIRLPEGRDVIVDAKVSLAAYERYHATGDETVRASAIKEHLASLRNHIRGLSNKHYEDLEGIRTLDFVLMFIPIETAFFTALEHDPSLFSDGFEKNVIPVSPSTLLVTLRTIQTIWRNADQNENALKIARQAGGLYDKFIGFLESLEEVGRQLDKAKEAYQTSRDRLATGRGNLVRRAQQLVAMGVKANKALPDSYANELEEEETACLQKQRD